jgi:hypothetical protein
MKKAKVQGDGFMIRNQGGEDEGLEGGISGNKVAMDEKMVKVGCNVTRPLALVGPSKFVSLGSDINEVPFIYNFLHFVPRGSLPKNPPLFSELNLIVLKSSARMQFRRKS